MFSKLFDSIAKIVGFFKMSYIIFMITLMIVHFTFYINQGEYSEILDDLPKTVFGNTKVLNLLDNIFFNCIFFSLNIGVICFLYREFTLCNDYSDTPSREFLTISKVLAEIKNYFKISLAAFYMTHIFLYYKLYFIDFLSTSVIYLSHLHLNFFLITLFISIFIGILIFLKKKFL